MCQPNPPVIGECLCEYSGEVFLSDGVQDHHGAGQTHHEEDVLRRQRHRAEHLVCLSGSYKCYVMLCMYVLRIYEISTN